MATLSSLVVLLLVSNAALCYCQSCNPSGYLTGTASECNQDNGAECCQEGVQYPQYQCSPPVTGATSARMTINDFSNSGDGGDPSKCDNQYHSNDERVVVLPTGWYNGGSRCLKNISISGNGKSVLAKVVDECDSVKGCDKEHDFQPPCGKDIVDASRAVWDALEIPESQIGDYSVTWSECRMRSIACDQELRAYLL